MLAEADERGDAALLGPIPCKSYEDRHRAGGWVMMGVSRLPSSPQKAARHKEAGGEAKWGGRSWERRSLIGQSRVVGASKGRSLPPRPWGNGALL